MKSLDLSAKKMNYLLDEKVLKVGGGAENQAAGLSYLRHIGLQNCGQ